MSVPRPCGRCGTVFAFGFRYHDCDLKWIFESDVVVAEVTTSSLGVGYEIARAVEARKRTLRLFRSGEGKRLSTMISGCPGVTVRTYETEKEAADAIRQFLTG
ncbi:MAG TPA: hypothetical protein VN420_05045 [Candidatus Fimivivens sp.]|nr:hypothetical protein [Candidatus Fimivivens sp.]